MSDASTTQMRQRFEELVRRAEAEVAADPGGYKRRLMALALLGYVVIFLLLAVLVALLGGTLALAFTSTAAFLLLFKSKAFVLLAVPIWVLGRSLLVRISPPDGYQLRRMQHPELWRELDRLRGKLGALKIHRVVLTPHMNAAITQTPRLGIFGPYRNTLVLGLELLMSMTPAQARAVLAHELGHLSAQHGRFGAWIYRKRLTWARIQAAFEANHSLGTGLVRRFMGWYVPRLAGYSFALARQQEYEADRVAVELTSPRDMASALALVGTRDAITGETFWKPLLRRANSEPQPEPHTFTRLYEHLRSEPLDTTLAEEKLAAAMRVRTGYADTHPALKDRLAAIGAAPDLRAGEQSAAEAWLGGSLEALLGYFDSQWLQMSAQGWAQRHDYARAAVTRLKELSAKSADQLTQMEAWQVAHLTEEFVPQLDALSAFRAYQARYPDDLDAEFMIGRLLILERDDEAGVAHLERAAASPALRERAYGMIAAYYRHAGRHEQAEHWLARAEAAYDEGQAARAERDKVTSSDRFKAAGHDEATLRALAAAIRATSVAGRIGRIWVAEKVLRHMPEHPLTVVIVRPRLLARKKAEIGPALVRELQQAIPLRGTWYFVVERSESRALARKVKAAGRELAG